MGNLQRLRDNTEKSRKPEKPPKVGGDGKGVIPKRA